ncbi:GTP pyrophosphokinase [Helicobacter pullorum]|uniref:GTP pyrophosphokinase n=1 Tax=Helicobacter pullorum TaxID=35818 RepID=UPI0006CD0188|nr:hypothetical protein [Helicobacter pullorum]KPH52241.1 hypothetical protein HPU229254_03060 [Helicobacter pullorum]
MVLSMEGQDKFVDVMANYDVDEIVKKYEKSFEIYESFETILKNYIQGLLDKAIQEGKLDKESVEIKSRTKEIESFKGKISRDDKKLKYKDPLSEITDLVGIKIMLTSLKDENIVYELLKLEMKDNIDKENSVDKTEDIKKERKFGYLGRHLVVFYDENMFELGKHLINKEIHPSHFKGLRAEIQVKTLLQHVWAEVEHKARYKAGEELSNDKKRYFDRLAALIEVADDLFKDLVEESERVNKISRQIIAKEQESVMEHTDSKGEALQENIPKIEINSEAIALYLANEAIKQKFKNLQKDGVLYVLSDEEPSFVSVKFIELLKEAGIFYTKDLEGLFSKQNVEIFHKYAQKELEANKYPSRLQKLSVLQILIYCKADEIQRKKIKTKRLMQERVCRLLDTINS